MNIRDIQDGGKYSHQDWEKILMHLFEAIEDKPSRFNDAILAAVHAYVKYEERTQRKENEVALMMSLVPKKVRDKILAKINQESLDPWTIQMLKKTS